VGGGDTRRDGRGEKKGGVLCRSGVVITGVVKWIAKVRSKGWGHAGSGGGKRGGRGNTRQDDPVHALKEA